MICYKRWDVVVVPFPFSDSSKSKPRPALVLTDEQFNKNTTHPILAMITSAARTCWGNDAPITDKISAGLPIASVVRPKLFSLDQRVITRKIGTLSSADQVALIDVLKEILP